MTPSHSIKRRAFLGLAAGSLLMLTGCSVRRTSEAAGPGDATAFPLTVEHALGSTTINRLPTRIVTVGRASGETCLAFGVDPVGMGVGRDGLSSWFTDEQVEAGVIEPALFSDEEIPKVIEVIRDLRPDVILAVNSDLDRSDYDALTELAPVVAYPHQPGNTEWRVSTQIVGQVLGRTAQTPQVISRVENAINEAFEGFQSFGQASGLYLTASSTPGAGFTVWGADTNPMRILREFGLTDASSLSQILSQGTPVLAWGEPVYQQVVWPVERVAELIADVPVVSIRADEAKLIESNRVLEGVPGARQNRIVKVQSRKDATALEEASPLSVAWTAKNMISEIARVRYSETKQG